MLLPLMLQPSVLRAQQDKQNPVVWSLEANRVKQPLHPGDKFSVVLVASITRGWHLYSISQPPGGPTATVITIPKQQPFLLANEIKGPEPEKTFDPNFQMEIEFYEESASFTIPLVVAASTAAGKQELQVTVRFQSCSDRLCLPPTTLKPKVSLAVVTGANAVRSKNSNLLK